MVDISPVSVTLCNCLRWFNIINTNEPEQHLKRISGTFSCTHSVLVLEMPRQYAAYKQRYQSRIQWVFWMEQWRQTKPLQ